MGDDGVTEQNSEASPAKTYADIFHEAFPMYLMMGMTSEEFWDGDSWLVRGFQKAYQMRKEQEYRERDELAWRNGAYLRKAIQSVYLMVNGFVPKGAKAEPYPERPYFLEEEEKKREEEKRDQEKRKKQKEEDQMRIAMAYFQASVTRFNKNIEKKKLEEKLNSIPHQ